MPKVTLHDLTIRLQVRVSFFVSGLEKAYVVFDAHGTSKTSWFNCDKILYTSYNDLNRDTSTSHCSVVGYVDLT